MTAPSTSSAPELQLPTGSGPQTDGSAPLPSSGASPRVEAGGLPQLLAQLLAQGWGRAALVGAGALVVLDGIGHWWPSEGSGLVLLTALGAGGWLLLGRRAQPQARLPQTLSGWISRCEQVLEAFARLDPDAEEAQAQRRLQLTTLLQEQERPQLRLAVLGTDLSTALQQAPLVQGLRGARGLELALGDPLPLAGSRRPWPASFLGCDAFLYGLRLPLSAADLRWLEAVPEGMPLWLLVQLPSDATAMEHHEPHLSALADQWPGLDRQRLLLWSGEAHGLAAVLQPLARWLGQQAPVLRATTPCRCLALLHGRWQAELEELRRAQFQGLQQRTQWLVAAGVVASPLPSLDLLVLAVANGLMLQEMARLWECPWSGEQLRAAAQELGRAALAQGVVEWSSQALAAAIKLHGATWLVGGALQALSAAYLTRVVGRAMADVLALSAGVSAPDLERIKREAPLLVARAAEAEKVDWAGFLVQGRRWFQQQALNPAS